MREDAGARLAGLAAVILRWNEAMNLVSRRDTGRLVEYHFADSASLLPLVAPARGFRILDVGGSNGLPGLVLSSICPEAELLICDGRKKRAGFLEEACRETGSGNRFEIGNVNDAGFVRRNAESFELIVARAVTRLSLLVRWCLPLLARGGVLAAYKGSRCGAEVSAARRHFFGHGGSLLAVLDSPFKERYNPLRKFAIGVKGD